MKPSVKAREVLIDAVCWLYILLFVYAAVSKLMEYEHFTVEIAKSPLLSAFAELVPAGVIAVELIASVLLLSIRFKFWGLVVAFALMTSFTVYIIIILNWSSFIPCSCGGILSHLGWWEHLAFNVSFLVLAAVAIALHPVELLPASLRTRKKQYAFLTILFFVASLVVFVLYYMSEDKTHRNNAFIRRYPHDPTVLWKGVDIRYNSYYVAGEDNGWFYLGNTTAPSHVLIINPSNGIVDTATIQLPDPSKLQLYAPKVRVYGGEFHLFDNVNPTIFKGNIDDWQGHLSWQGESPLQQLEPIGGDNFAFSKIGQKGNTHVIGVLNAGKHAVKLSDSILKSQSGEIFDTDGMLHYNPALQKILYLYYYRNEYLSFSRDLGNIAKGKTIDTIQKAIIPIAREDSGRIRTIATPPIMVNNFSCTAGQYLFVKSGRLGRYERGEMLKDASIIDVYDLKKLTYEFSFYLYNYKDEEIKTFKVYNNILIGLTKDHVVFYKLDNKRFTRLANK